jgi:hypothetical protein
LATQRLQILSTVNYLTRLRVLANNVIMIDFVFANLITRGGRGPMSIDRCAMLCSSISWRKLGKPGRSFPRVTAEFRRDLLFLNLFSF